MADLSTNVKRHTDFTKSIKNLIVSEGGSVPAGTHIEEYPLKLEALINAGSSQSDAAPITRAKPIITLNYIDRVTGEIKQHRSNVEFNNAYVTPSVVGNVQRTDNNPPLDFRGLSLSATDLGSVKHDLVVNALYAPSDGYTYVYGYVTQYGLGGVCFHVEIGGTLECQVSWQSEPVELNVIGSVEDFDYLYGDLPQTINAGMRFYLRVKSTNGAKYALGFLDGTPFFEQQLMSAGITSIFFSDECIGYNADMMNSEEVSIETIVAPPTMVHHMWSAWYFGGAPHQLKNFLALPSSSEYTNIIEPISMRSFSIPSGQLPSGLSFDGWKTLEEVIIPNANSLPNNVFTECGATKYILGKTTGITTIGYTGIGINYIPSASTKIYVPSALLSRYKTATGWGDWSYMIYPLSDLYIVPPYPPSAQSAPQVPSPLTLNLGLESITPLENMSMTTKNEIQTVEMRKYTASEGKVFRRIDTGFIYGNKLSLGMDYSQEEPRLDLIEYYEEIDEPVRHRLYLKG